MTQEPEAPPTVDYRAEWKRAVESRKNVMVHPPWACLVRSRLQRPDELRRWTLADGLLSELQVETNVNEHGQWTAPVMLSQVNPDHVLTFAQVKEIWSECNKSKRPINVVALEVIGEDAYTPRDLERHKGSRRVFVNAPRDH